MADPSPALPWAQPGDVAADPSKGETGVDQEEEPQFLNLEQANLVLGARIEVRLAGCGAVQTAQVPTPSTTLVPQLQLGGLSRHHRLRAPGGSAAERMQ